MLVQKGMIILEDCKGYSPNTNGVEFTEQPSGVRVFIPYDLLVRLYEGSKFQHEKRGGDWDSFCDSLFTPKKG